MARTPNRRDSVRYSTIENRAILTFPIDGVYVEIEVSLADISQSGCQCVAGRLLPLSQTVWVRLEAPTPTEWVEATPIGITKVKKGFFTGECSYRVRLHFIGPCPYDFYKMAVHGPQVADRRGGDVPPECSDGFWR